MNGVKNQSSVFWLESRALSATDALFAAAAAVAFLDETTAKIHIGLGLRCWLLGDNAFQRDGLHRGLLLGRGGGRHFGSWGKSGRMRRVSRQVGCFVVEEFKGSVGRCPS